MVEKKSVIGKSLLLELLHSRGMTQADLSAKTGISRSTINSYINNSDRGMTLANARVIAKALKCRIDDLYEWRL